jgi:hypothetical protein
MRYEDRQLLSALSQVNTALPAFALRVMDNTATPAEHHTVADHLITLGASYTSAGRDAHRHQSFRIR